MNYLLDTHLLLWSMYRPERMPKAAISLLGPLSTAAYFSTVSLIEIAIKQRTGKLEFSVDLSELRHELLRYAFGELQIKGTHAIALAELASLHKDPFDRLLVAQASVEELILLTVDKKLAGYGSMVLPIK